MSCQIFYLKLNLMIKFIYILSLTAFLACLDTHATEYIKYPQLGYYPERVFKVWTILNGKQLKGYIIKLLIMKTLKV